MTITFDRANALLDEITAFLISCGGVYTETHTSLERRVLDCIISGQYLLERDEHGISTAVIYWMIHNDDIPTVARKETPKQRTGGDIAFIVELGNRGGPAALWRVTRQIRNMAPGGVLGHNKGIESCRFFKGRSLCQ